MCPQLRLGGVRKDVAVEPKIAGGCPRIHIYRMFDENIQDWDMTPMSIFLGF